METDIKAGLESSAGEDSEDQQHSFMVFLNLRMDTVERVAKHDAEAALAFLKATAPPSDKELPYDAVESVRSFESRLAKQVEKQNPELALELARQSLKRGYSPDLLPLLRRMLKNHRDRGSLLYKDYVAKLVGEELFENWEATNFAINLAQSFKPPAVDTATFRKLNSLLLTSALDNDCDKDPESEFCFLLGGIFRQLEEVDPVRAAKLKKWAREESATDFIEARNEMNELMESGTADDLLALAKKFPEPQIAFMVYWQAMTKAIESGDLERAQKIAEECPDPERREAMLARVQSHKEVAVLSEERLAEVEKVVQMMRSPAERVSFLVALTRNVGLNQPVVARKLLAQADEIVSTMKPGKDQTASQFELATTYCLEKDERGFAIIGSVVPRLNELVSAASKLDGYDNRYLRDGEWNMSAEGGVGELLTSLAQNATYFAWFDFDRAVTLTGQFERMEIRMMAQLKLAQGILSGPPRRLPVGAGLYTH